MDVALAGAQPLSVVVAAWNSPALLRSCLQSLAVAGGELEIVVACPAERGFNELLAVEFPTVIRATLGPTATVPQLRKAGLARASGDIVAFIEDHATVAPEWAAALRAGYEADDRAALGGPVAQGAGLSSVDWAAYLFDYGRFMPPHHGGPVPELSGLNMSFARSLLDGMGEVLRDGVFEGALHQELARRRVALYVAPSAIVCQNKRFSLRQALSSVYYLGRGYAGRRLAHAGRIARLARAAACPLLPVVLLWRILSVVLPKGRDTWRVMRSLGFLAMIALSWSAGECVGCLAGSGDSDSRWR
ncbi:MAG: glycosyltransferase family 2 protein [Gemmatimonadota bacterium]|nr:glycosyltransferase family 2 protein [Gemmatimonadota bacterium]